MTYARSIIFAAMLPGLLAGTTAALARDRSGSGPATPPPNDHDHATLARLARRLRAEGQTAMALEAFERLARATPQDHSLRLELADAQLAAGRLDDATGTYQDLLSEPRQRGDARLGLMRTNFALGNFEGVLAQFAMLAEYGPVRDARAWLFQAVALDRLNRHEEAQAGYRAALAIAPRSVATRNNLALSLALVQRYDEAVAILLPLAASSTATPQLRQNLALVYGLMGNGSAAEKLARQDLTPLEVAQNSEFYRSVRP